MGFLPCSAREADGRLFGLWKSDNGYGKAAGGLEACITVGRVFALHERNPVFSPQHYVHPGTVAQTGDPKSHSKFLSLKNAELKKERCEEGQSSYSLSLTNIYIHIYQIRMGVESYC